MPEVDLAIVGGGPAGLSTAMHLLRIDPSWKRRMVVLEKAAHPRSKLCAGGVTAFGLSQLEALGLSLDVPHVPVEEARLEFQNQRISIYGQPAFVVTQRSEFDAWLAEQARQRGVWLLENHGVERLDRTPHGFRLSAFQGEAISARALVGADGATGIMRRWLGAREHPSRVARLLEVVSAASGQEPEIRKQMARFDFNPLKERVQGYYWDFPSTRAGKFHLNSGVYDSRVAPGEARAHLPQVLGRRFQAFDRPPAWERIQGHPIHWFSPTNRFAAPGVILVGDAAGADPLFGEGIGPALGYGAVAAEAVQDAFARADLSFRAYPLRLLMSPVGRYLALRWLGASLAYRLCRQEIAVHVLWGLGRLIAWLLNGRHTRPIVRLPARSEHLSRG